jgi:chorismate lyase/3-hydroxybenzoate synthase
LQAHDRSDSRLTQPATGVAAPAQALPGRMRVEFLKADAVPPAGLLAAIHYGSAPFPAAGVPLAVNVRLEPLAGSPLAELWYASGRVSTGVAGAVRYVCDDHYMFALLEMDERAREGVLHTAELAYTAVRRFQQASGYPHLLRMWNYLDTINDGSGDLERYRQFCVGRARGLAEWSVERFPAATAIGRQNATHDLQVFWLAARAPGKPIENPRQVSAYHYPRVHGPVSPSFSRATLAAEGTLLISGTASIVGHVSHHHDDASEQLEETLRNLAALQSADPAHMLLKVYLRDPSLQPLVAARLREVYPKSDVIFLAADICRRELLLEIEMMHLP